LVEIVLVKSNSIIYHPRCVKILKSLNKKYSIQGLGWNRESLEKKIIDDFFVKLKLFNLKAPFSKKSLLAFFPLFWIWIFFKLIVINPKVIHSCDLDTVIPCYLYKILFRKKLVFNVFDRIAMSRISPKNKRLYSLVNYFEEQYCKRSDVFITVTEDLLNTFKRKPKHCALILNCAEDHNSNFEKIQNKVLTLCCTAPITKTQGLGRITAAIENLDNVKVVFAGRVLDKDFFEQVTKSPKVKYKGLLLPQDSIALEASSDVIISLYDLSVPNYSVALSVKTFEAIMLGLPVITNISHKFIEEVGCGIEVDWNDLNQIKSAIIKLRDDIEFRRKLGTNGRKAFDQKYNWYSMEKKLYEIHEALLKN